MLKEKHLKLRVWMCEELQRFSNCPRRQFAAVLFDEDTMTVEQDAYNGGPRGGGRLCGGDTCTRSQHDIPSGEQVQIGCHHAEMNLIANCAATGISMRGKIVLVTGPPCLMCAKLLHHTQIKSVLVINKHKYNDDGVQYLIENNVRVEYYDRKHNVRVPYT